MLSQSLDPCGFTADVVLAEVVAARRGQVELAARVMEAAAAWADLHPGLDPDWVAFASSHDDEIPLAGDGVPLVDARCIAELGAALEMSPDAAHTLIGDALELRHRLPRLWTRVLSLQVPAWEARRVAQLTRPLSRAAVAFVDVQLQVLTRMQPGRVDRLVDAAIARFMPDLAERQRQQSAQVRRVDIDPCRTGPDPGPLDGLASVSGILDLADAIDLDHALTRRAAELGRLGVDGSEQVRRSIALGDLARAHQDTLDLAPSTFPEPVEPTIPEPVEGPVAATSTFPEPVEGPATFPEPFDKLRTGSVEEPAAATSTSPEPVEGPSRQTPGRQVVLYVHLSESALTGANEVCWLDRHTAGRTDLVDAPLLSGQIRDWCRHPDVKIIVKPVIDLHDTISVPGYQVPDRILERIRLRDGYCVFPNCRNRRTDADHRDPYDHEHPEHGGQTSTDELAPLCRRHHRLKTHTRWRYRMIRAGCYLWTSPYGRCYLRDEFGTYPLE